MPCTISARPVTIHTRLAAGRRTPSSQNETFRSILDFPPPAQYGYSHPPAHSCRSARLGFSGGGQQWRAEQVILGALASVSLNAAAGGNLPCFGRAGGYPVTAG
jgi:hypothetical protein